MRLCFLKQANYWKWKLYVLSLETKMEKWIEERSRHNHKKREDEKNF